MTKSKKVLSALSIMVSLGLLTAQVAKAEVVVVVSAKSSEGNMTADQVSQIFLGKSTNLTPVDQSEGAIKAEFYKKVTDKDPAQVKSIWSKIVFTGKGTPPKEVGGSAEVKKAVANDPKAIGYIEKSAVDSSVKVVLTAN